MITVKDQVSMMFGKYVADELDEAGLLVRDSHDPTYRSAGVVDDTPQFWVLKAEWDGVTPTPDWPSNSFDHEIKTWLRSIYYKRTSMTGPTPFSRRFEKAWPNHKRAIAHRMATMLRKYGATQGITVELKPAVLVEL
jgi:hypothetical protein